MSQKIPCHLDPEDLERYVRQPLSAEEQVRVEEHLLLCEPCREALANVESFVVAMRDAAAEYRLARPTVRSWWRIPHLVPIFAGLAILLLGVAVVPRFLGTSQPSFAVSLAATRGVDANAVAPAGRALSLTPDLTGLPADSFYRLEMVDEQGTPTWQGRYSAAQAPIRVGAQRAGAHFVRVYSSAGVLLREYGLTVGSPR